MKDDNRRREGYYSELVGFRRAVPVLLVALAVFIAVCFITTGTGVLGNTIGATLLGLLGAGAYAIPAMLILHAVFYSVDYAKKLTLSRAVFSLITVLIVSTVQYTVAYYGEEPVFAPVEFYTSQTAGGFIGSIIAFGIVKALGNVGLWIIALATIAIYIAFFFTRGDGAYSRAVLSIIEVIARFFAAIERKIRDMRQSSREAREERERQEEERRSAELMEDPFFTSDGSVRDMKIPELGIDESGSSKSSGDEPALLTRVHHESPAEETEGTDEVQIFFANPEAAEPIQRKPLNLSYGLEEAVPEVEEEAAEEEPEAIEAEAPAFKEFSDRADSVFTGDFEPFDFSVSEKVSVRPSSRVQPKVEPEGISEVTTPLSAITEEDMIKLERSKELERRRAEFERSKRMVLGRDTTSSRSAEIVTASAPSPAVRAETSSEELMTPAAKRAASKTVEFNVARAASTAAPVVSDTMTIVFDKPDFPADETDEAAAKIAAVVEKNVPGYARSANRSYTYTKVTMPEEIKAAPEQTEAPTAAEVAFDFVNEGEAAPVAEVIAPAVENVAPVAESVAPVVENVAPVVESAAPAVENVAPVAEAVAPVAESVAPVVENVAPMVESVAPMAEAVAPVVENVAPVAESAAPVVENITPAVENLVPAVENVEPIAEVVEPAAEAAAPALENAYSLPMASGDGYTKVIDEYNTERESETTESVGEFKSFGDETPTVTEAEPAEELKVERVMLAPTPKSVYSAAEAARDSRYTVIDANTPAEDTQPAPEEPVDTIEWAKGQPEAREDAAAASDSEVTMLEFEEDGASDEGELIVPDDTQAIFGTPEELLEDTEEFSEAEAPEEELAEDGEENEIPPEEQNPAVIAQRAMFPFLDREERVDNSANAASSSEGIFGSEVSSADTDEALDDAASDADGASLGREADGDESLADDDGAVDDAAFGADGASLGSEADGEAENPDVSDGEAEGDDDYADDYGYGDDAPMADDEADIPPFDLDEAPAKAETALVPAKAAKEQKKAEKPDYSNYEFPPIELLGYDEDVEDENIDAEIQENMDKLLDTLASFDVTASIKGVDRGPRITRYEVVPAKGIKVSKVMNLQDDIALSLAAGGIRMEAPIPGKSAIGVEIPNKHSQTVRLRELIECEEFRSQKSKTAVCVGKDVAGAPVFNDIANMPHLLIAGATGMGKSVSINALLISMLYKARPDEVKLIMIDPKQVEFTLYDGIPHLLVPVVSDAKQAAGALMWAVDEMNKRYEIIRDQLVRNIDAYNAKVAEDPSIGEPMPKIVIVIDEFADLMLQVRDPVESLVMSIAQKARAAGIHLIVGTQRPSVNVITGTIKANIPSRMSCKVSSIADSRTILEASGAEKLLNRGDMLFAFSGAMKPIRVQGAFVSDSEVEAVMTHLKKFSNGAVYDESVMEEIKRAADKCNKKGSSGGGDFDDGEEYGEGYLNDRQFIDAVEVALSARKISTSLLQRRLSIGYGKAAKFLDVMCDMGIVGEQNGSKPREVRITADEWREKLARTMYD